jgi:head-tail adaptor
MPLAAGDLDRRISIERDVGGRDDHGNDSPEWRPLARCWAQAVFGTGMERREAAQERAGLTATFRIRRTSATKGAVPGDRIDHAGLVWDIKSVARLGLDGLELTAVTAYQVLVRALTGAIHGTSTLAGTLSVRAALTGHVAGAGALTSVLTVRADLAGGVAGSAALAGTVAVRVGLLGNLTGFAALGGTVSVRAALAAGITGAAALNGSLAVRAPLAGAVTGSSALGGTFTVRAALSGAVEGTSSLSGSVAVAAHLTGAVAGAATLAGTITVTDSNLARNGTFDSATIWTVPANCSISGGVLTKVAGSGTRQVTQTPGTALVQGAIYKTSYDVTAQTAGGPRVLVGGAAGTQRTAVGTYTEYVAAGAGSTLGFTFTSTTAASVDNLSIYATTVTAVGSETIQDPGFDTGTGWALFGGATISGGQLTLTNGDIASATHSPSLGAGVPYRVTYTLVSIGGGSLSPSFGTSALTAPSTAGTYTQDVVSISNPNLQFLGPSGGCVIDNVSVKPLTLSP